MSDERSRAAIALELGCELVLGFVAGAAAGAAAEATLAAGRFVIDEARGAWAGHVIAPVLLAQAVDNLELELKQTRNAEAIASANAGAALSQLDRMRELAERRGGELAELDAALGAAYADRERLEDELAGRDTQLGNLQAAYRVRGDELREAIELAEQRRRDAERLENELAIAVRLVNGRVATQLAQLDGEPPASPDH